MTMLELEINKIIHSSYESDQNIHVFSITKKYISY